MLLVRGLSFESTQNGWNGCKNHGDDGGSWEIFAGRTCFQSLESDNSWDLLSSLHIGKKTLIMVIVLARPKSAYWAKSLLLKIGSKASVAASTSHTEVSDPQDWRLSIDLPNTCRNRLSRNSETSRIGSKNRMVQFLGDNAVVSWTIATCSRMASPPLSCFETISANRIDQLLNSYLCFSRLKKLGSSNLRPLDVPRKLSPCLSGWLHRPGPKAWGPRRYNFKWRPNWPPAKPMTDVSTTNHIWMSVLVGMVQTPKILWWFISKYGSDLATENQLETSPMCQSQESRRFISSLHASRLRNCGTKLGMLGFRLGLPMKHRLV